MRCPRLLKTVIVSDEPQLAAQLSCALAQRGAYLPLLDGPRLGRSDADAESTRRTNAMARMDAQSVLLAGLPTDAALALEAKLPKRMVRRIERGDDIGPMTHPGGRSGELPLRWGRDRIGVGLLKALRERKLVEFFDEPSPEGDVASLSGHLVVCEAGEELSEVIAANYAFSLDAGLVIIPEVPKPVADEILEALYGAHENSIENFNISPTQLLDDAKHRLRDCCRDVNVPTSGSLTFVTRRLPFGFAFQEFPSTHLFSYPDLGVAVINGFSAEQPGTRGVNVAVLVDPMTTDAPEIAAATKILPARRIFVRGYRGSGATVHAVSQMVDLFPYDLLIFATHCGDTEGYRWTYEFQDGEGIDRTLVVDIALSIAQTVDPEILDVTEFMRFHSLDGVGWNDPHKADKIHIGTAIADFVEKWHAKEIKPVQRDNLERVAGSAAMRMFDNNYIALPRSLADESTPIVINNACASWHELAGRFTFANARAYVGTLFPIFTTEAHDVIVRLLDKHAGKSLPHALWSAQNDVYGHSVVRRPYVATGVYPQSLRTTIQDAPKLVFERLAAAAEMWARKLETAAEQEPQSAVQRYEEFVAYYRREAASFKKRWLDN